MCHRHHHHQQQQQQKHYNNGQSNLALGSNAALYWLVHLRYTDQDSNPQISPPCVGPGRGLCLPVWDQAPL